LSERPARKLVPVVLSGGSGTRLWPMSREHRPKQFLPLVRDHSLFQDALRRTQTLRSEIRPPIVVCNTGHRFLVAEELLAAGLEAQTIVLEPVGRNTAPAVAVAALLAQRAEQERAEGDADADPLLLVLPADHVILDLDAFSAAVEVALEAAESGRLVTFGVVPSGPETGYGYLLRGEDRGGWADLARFVEKPDVETARGYVESGTYLWNSGMFLFSAQAFLRELERCEPAMAAACRRAVAEAHVDADFTRLGAAFGECPANSIDYAVMERTAHAAVVPLDARWSDVCSWPALHDVLPKDAAGNALSGDVVARSCANTYVAANSRLVAAVGLEGIIVVETADAVLVTTREHAQDVKGIVEELKSTGRGALLGERQD
jgi:mannose-1-phosphate guanylyltransferase/mannose-6-phosphate isomerase